MIGRTLNLMAPVGEQIMTGQGRNRRLYGLVAALIILVILVAHLEGSVKLDTVALGLLAAMAASLLFAFSERLGITEIGAVVTMKFTEGAADAAKAIPTHQRKGQYLEVLNKNQDLWPATGARVLWVDDHPEEFLAHRQVLRRLGFQVVFVTSTHEAISELKRDPDFVLMIQDYLRRGNNTDAKKLVDWVNNSNYEPPVPLVVYSYNQFNDSLGVESKDWIKQDFTVLLERVAKEVRAWPERYAIAGRKPPK